MAYIHTYMHACMQAGLSFPFLGMLISFRLRAVVLYMCCNTMSMTIVLPVLGAHTHTHTHTPARARACGECVCVCACLFSLCCVFVLFELFCCVLCWFSWRVVCFALVFVVSCFLLVLCFVLSVVVVCLCLVMC